MLTQEEGCREDVGRGVGGSKHVKGTINRQLQNWAHILGDPNVICTLRGGGKKAGWQLALDWWFLLGQINPSRNSW